MSEVTPFDKRVRGLIEKAHADAYRLGFYRGLFLGFLSAVLVAAFIDVVFVR